MSYMALARKWRPKRFSELVGQEHVLRALANLGLVLFMFVVGYEVDLRQVRRGRLALGVANGQVYADDVCVYTASDLKVGLFTSAA